MITKKCTGLCGQIKNIDEFFVRADNGKPNGRCKKCVSEYYEKYRKNKKEEIKEYKKFHYENNKEQILADKKIFYEENKKQILTDRKQYYEENKAELQVKHKEYYDENKATILKQKKIYYTKNKKHITEYTKQYFKTRRINDPSFALRNDLSTLIGRTLKYNAGSKLGKSITDYLPYTIKDLKEHMEIMFEPWMNWQNRGKYNSIKWDDNDMSTWTWQLDHIIPHSKFHYTSMKDQSFKDCWALSNLRPFNSKKNQLDGATKIRHK